MLKVVARLLTCCSVAFLTHKVCPNTRGGRGLSRNSKGMPIDDGFSITPARAPRETDVSQPMARLNSGDGIARARSGAGLEGAAPAADTTRPSFDTVMETSLAESEEAHGHDMNPLLNSLGNLLAPPEAASVEQSAQGNPSALGDQLRTSLELALGTRTSNPFMSLVPSSMTSPNVLFAQPQLAGALAFGGLVAGCAVGALTLGLGGAIIAVAAEALAFAGGLLVSRAGQMQMKELNERLLFDANHDPLTGLCNRRSLMDGLEKISARAANTTEDYGVMMVDADHFKSINDTYGHQAGDEVLRALAGRMKECLRDGTVEGRYGGEEFLVVIPQANTEMIAAVAQRVRRAVADDPVATEWGPIAVTVSIGVAASDRAGKVPDRLVRAADEALYRAKQGGRNRVEVALVPVA